MNIIYGIAYNTMNMDIVISSERYDNLEKAYKEFKKIEEKNFGYYEKKTKFSGIINGEMFWTCVSIIENPDKLENEINSIKIENDGNNGNDENEENHGKFCDLRFKIFHKYYNEINKDF